MEMFNFRKINKRVLFEKLTVRQQGRKTLLDWLEQATTEWSPLETRIFFGGKASEKIY